MNNMHDDLTPQDALDYIMPGTQVKHFTMFCSQNKQRKGQAWFNALSLEDQTVLRNSYSDPFYSDGWESILYALQCLLDAARVEMVFIFDPVQVPRLSDH